MKPFLAVSLLLFFSLITACTTQSQTETANHHSRFSQHVDAEGVISIEALQMGYPIFRVKREYQPANNSIQQFNALEQPTSIKAFFGTWCHDSQREIPDLITFYHSLDNPKVKLTLIALDRSKSDRAGLAAKANVKYTPTIVVSQNGQELGRIIEKSDGPMDRELLSILQSK
ncbi:TlpA family protein disulfide reductase [Kangiella shandongensis]|uniref:TlpA family protein disulfide reductase n=1 Tax=Kangiella shandongensis TaxID=2763258 RepID=UPI001CBEA985|nr:thioredoxin domain-containing protein [Kangiella shandongensis]